MEPKEIIKAFVDSLTDEEVIVAKQMILNLVKQLDEMNSVPLQSEGN